jgi:hypothetical protein
MNRLTVVRYAAASVVAVFASSVGLATLLHATAPPVITVVNMMPRQYSTETTQNSEPSLAINENIPGFVVGSAFASGLHFCSYKANAPIFVSNDDGNNWSVACILPTATTRWPQDMTVRISGNATALYATTLDAYNVGGKYRMFARVFGWSAAPSTVDALFTSILSGSTTYLAPPGAKTLYSRESTDQPYLRITKGGQREMFVVGENRAAALGGGTAGCQGTIVAYSNDPWATTPSEQCLGVERPFSGTITASRAAMADGATYVLSYRPVNVGADNDVVLYKRSRSGFDGLKDTPATGSGPVSTDPADCGNRDGRMGRRVVACAHYSDPASAPHSSDFGFERRMSMELAIAVNPSDAKKIVIAWAGQSLTATKPTHTALHFKYSENGGNTWSISPWVPDHATNPTLAIASDGAIGVLYQELVDVGGVDHWRTQLAISSDKLASTPTIYLLADFNANDPGFGTDPYLGDYLHLEASGRNFYGAFPTGNDLSSGNGSIPNLCPATTCTTQRRYDSTGRPIDREGNIVQPSIDPYFVRVIR